MNEKKMNRKTAVIVLAFMVVAAIGLGCLLVNKGDGPVMGYILADRKLENEDAYQKAAKNHEEGIYLVVSNAFDKFEVEYQSTISKSKDLYITIYFVECPKGSEYNGKWIKDGNVIQEESKIIETGPQGRLSFLLDGKEVGIGSYTFELYDQERKILEKTVSIE